MMPVAALCTMPVALGHFGRVRARTMTSSAITAPMRSKRNVSGST